MDGLGAFDRTLSRILQKIERSGQPLVVAVSGGVDSMTLLTKTVAYANAHGHTCVAAHIHHGIRPEADTDAAFVAEAARALGIPCETRKVAPLLTDPRSSRGLEADARALRYRALAEIAQTWQADCVLLGHHADDQLETLLWRLARGTSASGIAGMKEASLREGMWWIRPLLSIPRTEIEAFARNEGISFVEDATNDEDDAIRNRIRHHVVPELVKITPQIARQTSAMMRIVQDENEFLDAQATDLLERCQRTQTEQSVSISVEGLKSAPLPLQRRAIQILLYCLTSSPWTSAHVESILRLARSSDPSGTVMLPQPWCAWREYQRLHLGRCRAVAATSDELPKTWLLSDEASLLWQAATGESWRFFCERMDGATVHKRSSLYETCIPDVSSLTIRPVDTRLRIQPMGMSGHRKLQDCLVDSKVPRRLRNIWPIAYISEDPVWVPGVVRAHAYQVTEGTAPGWLIRCNFEQV